MTREEEDEFRLVFNEIATKAILKAMPEAEVSDLTQAILHAIGTGMAAAIANLESERQKKWRSAFDKLRTNQNG